LTERPNAGLSEDRSTRKLTLVSAPAGFGKTTLVGEWVACGPHLEPKVQGAWLSLEEGDSDATRFLAYLIAALRTIEGSIGRGMLTRNADATETARRLDAVIFDKTATLTKGEFGVTDVVTLADWDEYTPLRRLYSLGLPLSSVNCIEG
jgi:hypothetical protein